jgi:uncharacterized protein (DUF2141 family)
LRAVAGLGALATLALAVAPLPAASTEGGTRVTITVTGLRNTNGVVIACMTQDARRFPRCRDDAASHRANVPAGEQVTLVFDHVTPGTYAIALLHDENRNGRADRALSMIPREGFGFSRDAPVRMGPPSFEAASFAVAASPITQTIRMRYML